MTYDQLIERKVKCPHSHGFEPGPVNPMLFDWQKLIVQWAIRQGRCALFEDCGLGKTPQQLEWARQVSEHSGGRVLILCPLAVAEQTVREGRKFGIAVNHVREPDQMRDGISITNYERLEKFSEIIPDLAGIVLDESSCIKSFTGKLRHSLTDAFKETPYRLCCTATPAPNDFDELGTQAEFLGVTTRQEMLCTWFINDTQNTGEGWRLKKHGQEDFWRWVSSWAACVSKPSDLGFDDGLFILPPLNIIPVWVDVDETESAGEDLFRIATMSATTTHREMRLTCRERVSEIAARVNESTEPWIVWCQTNYEADELAGQIPNAIEVRGSDTPERKEKLLEEFSNGTERVIITKASIAGYGLNWQHCSNVIYFPSYSFEDFYQAVRRSYRFGQTKPVNCYVVLPKTASNVFQTIKRKMEQHETMRHMMEFSAHELLNNKPITIMKTDVTTQSGNGWTLHHGDCVRASRTIADNSIDFSVFSPPFADLFVYSADVQDMGNCGTMDDFMEQFGFLVDNLYRITAPGRLCAVHCADLLATKWKDGEIELKNFSGQIIDAFRAREWLYHCRVTIWKDPVVEMQRTKSLGLLHKQLLKDSAMSRVGSPEYVCIFRKPGVNTKPIHHERADYPVELWQKDASPVWLDIRQTEVLNGELAREQSDERHICPLQLDVIERLLRMYSCEGDLVFSPFAGIGSEGYCAVKMKRRFIGCELKKSYFDLACSYLTRAESEAIDLFSLCAKTA